MSGKTIDLTSDNIAIRSNNFNVTKNGAMSCSSANVTGGNISGTTISLTGGTRTSPNFKVADNSKESSIIPGRIYLEGGDIGFYANSTSDGKAYLYADSYGGGLSILDGSGTITST